MVVESMDNFSERVYSISGEIQRQIAFRAKEQEKHDLPEVMQLKVAPPQTGAKRVTKKLLDTGLDVPSEIDAAVRSKVLERDYSDTIMGSVEDLRGQGVTITRMQRGHRDDGRDVILQGMRQEGRVKTQVDDMRLLFSSQEGVGNEVLASRLFRELNLPHYTEQGVLYPSTAESKKIH